MATLEERVARLEKLLYSMVETFHERGALDAGVLCELFASIPECRPPKKELEQIGVKPAEEPPGTDGGKPK